MMIRGRKVEVGAGLGGCDSVPGVGSCWSGKEHRAHENVALADELSTVGKGNHRVQPWREAHTGKELTTVAREGTSMGAGFTL